ncbi:MAG: hypothetical protein CGU28_00895 [Candidatus Dactylopiibacterium carminicum]|nr:MAG: hypothetical protein CGU28_00895 [Candidatus Dactylopiibacterium carminicum]
MHRSLAFAMSKLPVLDGRIEWLHAYSAREGLEILAREADIAVVMLDVVMEHEHAGLQMVRAIREDLGLHDTRIVLHTGQPGFAPEIAAVRDYDINDYRSKAQLTRGQVYTCLSSAIRAYRQIRTLEANRRTLREILHAGVNLMGQADDESFARTVLEQLAQLLHAPVNGFAMRRDARSGDVKIICAVKDFKSLLGHGLAALPGTQIVLCCQESSDAGGASWCERGLAISLSARDGSLMTCYLELPASLPRFVDEGVLDIFIGHFASCLDNHALLEHLHHEALYDSLLGLPNRRWLSEALDGLQRSGAEAAQILALIDVDRFGEINEALGQSFGDELLRAVGQRLRTRLADSLTVSRIAADTFAVLGDAGLLTEEELKSLFVQPLPVQGQEAMVSVTISLTRLGDVASANGAAVLEAGFQTLRMARQHQRGSIAWYRPEYSRQTQERVGLLTGLRQSLRSGGFFVVYQPQLIIATQALVGLEALVRWRTDSGELVGPDQFIPVAEQSGLIREIGLLVLRDACTELAHLHAHGQPGLRMAVNVSAIQFRHPDFLVDLRAIIAETGIDARCLELEITESIAMEDAAYVRQTLDALHTMGVQLAVDDFGTGYSSLAQLKRLAVDRLKIDRAFVLELSETSLDASIAGVVIQLGHRLGKAVIAEGVETPEQAVLLARLGCVEAQGYLYARPMSADELHGWMAARRA